jgi:hypothetical protein
LQAINAITRNSFTKGEMRYFEIDRSSKLEPAEMVVKCIEEGAASILLDEASLPAGYFDLSSGLLGELLHKTSTYRIPVAIVVQDPKRYSANFQSFLQEANQGNSIRSFATKKAAIQWLESIPSQG